MTRTTGPSRPSCEIPNGVFTLRCGSCRRADHLVWVIMGMETSVQWHAYVIPKKTPNSEHHKTKRENH